MAKSNKAQASNSSSKKTNQAEDVLRKVFLAGLGLAEETNERLHQTFNNLVKKGKTREPEIKKAVEEIRRKVQTQRKDLEKRFQNVIKDNELVKSKEFQSILRKLESFEKRGAESFSSRSQSKTSGKTGGSSASSASGKAGNKGAARPTAKKPAAKKTIVPKAQSGTSAPVPGANQASGSSSES